MVGFPTGTRPRPLQGDQTSSGTYPASYSVSTVGFLPPGMQDIGHQTSSGTCPVSYLVSAVGFFTPGMQDLGHQTSYGTCPVSYLVSTVSSLLISVK